MTRGPDKQFDRDEVLERAMRLFWRQGYEATGMSQLLTQMGIGRQSLYDTFGGKKALYLEALKRFFEQRMAVTRATLRAEGSPMRNIRLFFDSLIQMSQKTEFCGCFMGNTAAEFGGRDPEMEKSVKRFFEQLTKMLVETLEDAKEAGELREGTPVLDVAEMLIATTQGLALLSKIDPDPAKSSRLMDASLAMLGGGMGEGTVRPRQSTVSAQVEAG